MSKTEQDETIAVRREDWGKDHFSTLVYIETRCVDYKGVPFLDHLRCNPARHQRHGGRAARLVGTSARRDEPWKYGSVIRGGVRIPEHDDWDVLDDLVNAGLLEWNGTGENPVFKMTESGWALVQAIRKHKAAGGQFSDFREAP